MRALLGTHSPVWGGALSDQPPAPRSISFIHCDQRTCPAGERCSNRPFHALDLPPMEVFLTSEKGWGVRATGAIRRGTFVVEYAGEVIDDAEMSRRAEDAKRRNEPHFYMMEMAPGEAGGKRRCLQGGGVKG